MLKSTVGMGRVARCKEKFVLLQEINIAQLSLIYGTMKLQVQSIKPLASIFFLIPYYLTISVPLADFRIKIRIMSKIRINTDFSVHLATLFYIREPLPFCSASPSSFFWLSLWMVQPRPHTATTRSQKEGTDLWAKKRRYSTRIGNLGHATPIA